MSNPAITNSFALNRGIDVQSADNLAEFYGYGSMFMNQSAFVLDISERIHLFGADATPFFSWSSMVRKSPAKGVDFSWMEDELFLHRDVKALLRRRTPTTTLRHLYTLKLYNGGDWQAFEAAALNDAVVQSAMTADPTEPCPFISMTGVTSIWFIPTAYGLQQGPLSRSYSTNSAAAITLQNEIVLYDDTAGTGSVGGNTSSAYLKQIFSHHLSNGTAAGIAMTKAILDACITAVVPTTPTDIGTEQTQVVTLHMWTPNEILKGYAQGSGLPTESRKRSRTLKNYVQIFKTPYSIANTLKAVQVYGGPELAKLRYKKAIQHKVDIERAIIFQQGGAMDSAWGYVGGQSQENPLTRFKGLGVGCTDPALAGFIATKNGGYDAAFTLKEDGTSTQADLNALAGRIFEDTVDSPSSSKLVFASKKWMGTLAAMALKTNESASGMYGGQYRWGAISQKDGRLGVKIRTLETPFGDLNFVDMPHFRGQFENYALIVDMNNMEIKPLRDTQLIANCGEKTVDGQVDYYLTEIGFECRHESSHAILKLA
jgi:hypothetical protein